MHNAFAHTGICMKDCQQWSGRATPNAESALEADRDVGQAEQVVIARGFEIG
jgi:hypothetical protein